MNLHIYNTVEELLYAYAIYFIRIAGSYIKENGRFNVALSGGSSPQKVYELLATPSFQDQIDWSKVYFFFGDERYVPANDARNNALMVKKALFTPLNIADNHIFSMNTSLSPADCAKEYMEAINNHFNIKPIQFDLVLLGLGDNAHTASLFPFTPIIHEKIPTISEVFLKDDNAYRISFSAPLINQAKHVAFLVFGKNKAAALGAVIKGENNPDEFPAQLIQPESGDLHWFLDNDVASMLT
ncbi:MAG: 6-phosphogluconolactonase [Bacteroidetes bacterium]|nr:6-phosphogluconolactonase [Bacteroidota bacterium]